VLCRGSLQISYTAPPSMHPSPFLSWAPMYLCTPPLRRLLAAAHVPLSLSAVIRTHCLSASCDCPADPLSHGLDGGQALPRLIEVQRLAQGGGALGRLPVVTPRGGQDLTWRRVARGRVAVAGEVAGVDALMRREASAACGHADIVAGRGRGAGMSAGGEGPRAGGGRVQGGGEAGLLLAPVMHDRKG
jgi:hypothetical protein